MQNKTAQNPHTSFYLWKVFTSVCVSQAHRAPREAGPQTLREGQCWASLMLLALGQERKEGHRTVDGVTAQDR